MLLSINSWTTRYALSELRKNFNTNDSFSRRQIQRYFQVIVPLVAVLFGDFIHTNWGILTKRLRIHAPNSVALPCTYADFFPLLNHSNSSVLQHFRKFAKTTVMAEISWICNDSLGVEVREFAEFSWIAKARHKFAATYCNRKFFDFFAEMNDRNSMNSLKFDKRGWIFRQFSED